MWFINWGPATQLTPGQLGKHFSPPPRIPSGGYREPESGIKERESDPASMLKGQFRQINFASKVVRLNLPCLGHATLDLRKF
jgi:hypothetical protein